MHSRPWRNPPSSASASAAPAASPRTPWARRTHRERDRRRSPRRWRGAQAARARLRRRCERNWSCTYDSRPLRTGARPRMTALIDTIEHGAITELRLARAPVNALNPELCAALEAAVGTAVEGGAHGLV